MSAIARKKNNKTYDRDVSERASKTTGVDEPMVILILLLVAVGLVCLYSASYADAYYRQKGNSTFYVLRQGVFAAAGIAAMFAASRFDYHKLHFFAIPLMAGSTILLATIFVRAPLWMEINKAWRWINLGFTTFQPSEITKFAFILFFSSMATIWGPKKMATFKYGILPYGVLLVITAGLLYVQPHLSATVIIAGIGFVIIFLGGAPFKWLFGCVAAGIAAIAGYVAVNPYAMTRINVWLDPFVDAQNKGWQGSQSFLAISSGGIWGLGLGQSRQKHLFLPEPANDFIFSVICEELGFIGASLILILFAALILRGYYIASKAQDKFGMLLAAGITSHIAVQTIFNIGVVSGLFPVTGAALPFFSYGGTSLMMLLGEMGILLSVSRYRSSDEA